MTRYLKVFMAAAILCIPGWGAFGEPCQAASTIFHSYTKPVSPPDFAIEDLNGKKFNFKDPTGDVVLVEFLGDLVTQLPERRSFFRKAQFPVRVQRI